MSATLPAQLDPQAITTLAGDCRRVFGAGWTAARSCELHADLERLVDAASSAGALAVGDAALALAVYLCSMVEAAEPPPPALWPRIGTLCESLVSAIDRDDELRRAAVGTRRRSTTEPRAPVVVLLAPATDAYLQLAGAIGRRGRLVSVVDTIEALSRELDRRAVDLVVMTAETFDGAGQALAAIHRAAAGRLAEPATVAVLPAHDRARRMSALRAGIDRVLPAAAAEPLADGIGEVMRDRRAAAFRVLVVEDDRAQAMFVRAVLRHRGIDSQAVGSADAALAALAGFRPDLVLLDLHLPDLDGIELAQRLRERPDFDVVQIVFLSGETDADAHRRAVRHGGDDWVSKPVTPRQLLAVVDRLAGRARRLHGALGNQRGLLDRERFVDVLDAALHRSHRGVALVALTPLASTVAALDFVGQGRLGDDIAQHLLGLATLASGLCRAEPMQFLCLVVDEDRGQLVERLIALRADLAQHRWRHGGTVDFALAAVAIDREIGGAERWVQRVLGELALATDAVDRLAISMCGEPVAPASRTAAVLRRVLADDDRFGAGADLRFRPLLPAQPHLPGQFELTLSIVDRMSASSIERSALLAEARELALLPRLERCWLGLCLRRIRASETTGSSLRLVVPFAADAFEDPTLAGWIRSELQHAALPGDRLLLRIDAATLRGSPARTERLRAQLVEAGLRVAVGPLIDADDARTLCRLLEPACLIVAGDDLARAAAVRATAHEHGKFVWIDGIDQMARLAGAFAIGAHWLSGDAVSEPLAAPQFDFDAAG